MHDACDHLPHHERGCCLGCHRQRCEKGRPGISTWCSSQSWNLQKLYIDQLSILMPNPIIPRFESLAWKRVVNLFPCSDACRPAPGMDALGIWRTLFEPRELVRSLSCVRPIQYGRTGRQWFWAFLPKQKGLACRGETRQHRTLKPPKPYPAFTYW